MKWVKLLAVALCLPVAGAKPPPAVLTHEGLWNVHTSENACMLGRTFGSGDQAVLVAFQPLFNSTTGELFVMTGERHRGQRVGTATITLTPSGREDKPSYFSNVVPKEKRRVTRMHFPHDLWKGLDDTDVLAITAPPVSVRVKLVRFAAARAAFEKCERDLLASWKVDPSVLDADKAPRPLRNPSFFFSPDDYPIAAIQAGHVGRVVAILSVDAAGLVTGCRIGSSSWADLNDATCKQGRRVRFAPAQDAVGRPAPSIFILPVRWVMGGF